MQRSFILLVASAALLGAEARSILHSKPDSQENALQHAQVDAAIPTAKKLTLFVRTQGVTTETAPADDSLQRPRMESEQLMFPPSGSHLQPPDWFPLNQELRMPTQAGIYAADNQIAAEKAAAAAAAAKDKTCHPQCNWECGSSACNEVCEPLCAPPQCATACKTVNMATCSQKCEAPKCAIVCPNSPSTKGCKTLCAPPKCTSKCEDDCESKCSPPSCTWKCKPGACVKPKCSLKCDGGKACLAAVALKEAKAAEAYAAKIAACKGDKACEQAVAAKEAGWTNQQAPPFPEGMKVVSQGHAKGIKVPQMFYAWKSTKPLPVGTHYELGKGQGVR